MSAQYKSGSEIPNLNTHKECSYHRGNYHSESSYYHFAVSVRLQGLSKTLMALCFIATFHFKKTFSTKYNHVAYNVRMIKYKRPFGIKQQQQHLLTQSVAKIQLTT
uniref:Uncharacterized protein n=1 Tax=Glossina palpalis gambiensis TaxID=67801 RepID=A0A1B0B0X1_9MUSC